MSIEKVPAVLEAMTRILALGVFLCTVTESFRKKRAEGSGFNIEVSKFVQMAQEWRSLSSKNPPVKLRLRRDRAHSPGEGKGSPGRGANKGYSGYAKIPHRLPQCVATGIR